MGVCVVCVVAFCCPGGVSFRCPVVVCRRCQTGVGIRCRTGLGNWFKLSTYIECRADVSIVCQSGMDWQGLGEHGDPGLRNTSRAEVQERQSGATETPHHSLLVLLLSNSLHSPASLGARILTITLIFFHLRISVIHLRVKNCFLTVNFNLGLPNYYHQNDTYPLTSTETPIATYMIAIWD